MLKCLELTPEGIDTYHLPLEPATAPRLHADKGNTSIVVGYHTHRVDFARQPAALSIKCSFAGRINYVVDGRRMVVEEDRYLVVNHNHAYSSYVRSEQPVTAFSIFFGKPLVDDVLSSQTRAEEEVLADPLPGCDWTGFFENLYPHDPQLFSVIRALHASHANDDVHPDALVEWLHVLVAGLVRLDRLIRAKIAALPATRPATRLEIFRRVGEARDYLESHYPERLDLDTIAGHVAMSPHHFLRSFKAVVGTTPHRYLLDLRLEKARRLLELHDLPVAEAAARVGFESWEHFSRQFRRHFGASPGALRPKKQFSSFRIPA